MTCVAAAAAVKVTTVADVCVIATPPAAIAAVAPIGLAVQLYEVEDVNPEAVAELPPAFGHLAGMKVVDYARATA